MVSFDILSEHLQGPPLICKLKAPDCQLLIVTNLQAKLKLSLDQQKEWLRARRRLLVQLSAIRAKRDKFALSLGLLMLQNGQVHPFILILSSSSPLSADQT